MLSFYPFSSSPQKQLDSLQPASSSSPPADARRSLRKEGNFIVTHGQRHHSYDNEKAPYPLSYDRSILELEALETKLTQHLRNSISYINFNQHPKRVLDLGCGLGTWVIEAAKEWSHTEFIGFDLMNVQIPLRVLEDQLSKRIQWRHGNFLTTRLPFEDDEFDHIHVAMIARGVPENKWGNLFEEINRVLAPGGSCEVIEDDVVFPILPRWFTQALRSKPKNTTVHLPDGTNRGYPIPASKKSPDALRHDHALLESLCNAVYEQRFINLKPTALLPSYFTTYFRQVTLGPVVHFPMPPLAPLQPLPPQIITTYVLEPDSDTLNTRKSTFYPTVVPMNRPASNSVSSTMSSYTTATTNDSIFSIEPSSASVTSAGEPSPTNLAVQDQNLSTTNTEDEEPGFIPELPIKNFMLDDSLSDNETVTLAQKLFPTEQLTNLSARSLAMQLYRSCQTVLGCQEAMWEELADRIRDRPEDLIPYGWEDDDELEELQGRKKFEKMIERFKKDMHLRISFWYSLTTDHNWPLPEREPLTKAELMEEERIRANMLEARKQAKREEFLLPSRSMRVLVGYKL